MTAEIKLTKGKVALVDAADVAWLSKWKWHINKKGYAVRTSSRKDGKLHTIFMARLIMGLEFGDPRYVDHINSIPADNRRSNLRVCVPAENNRNCKVRSDNKSGFKGVHWHKSNRRWQASIRLDGSLKFLGYHETAEMAAKAYDAAAKDLFGEFAKLNFPEVSNVYS